MRKPISEEGEKVLILRVITSELVTKPAISAVSGATPLGDWEIYTGDNEGGVRGKVEGKGQGVQL